MKDKYEPKKWRMGERLFLLAETSCAKTQRYEESLVYLGRASESKEQLRPAQLNSNQLSPFTSLMSLGK